MLRRFPNALSTINWVQHVISRLSSTVYKVISVTVNFYQVSKQKIVTLDDVNFKVSYDKSIQIY